VPLIGQVRDRCGRRPCEVSADAGFCTEANLAAAQERRIAAYMPSGRARHGEASAAGRRPLKAKRRHERRATGRKANSSATVLRGSVRLTVGLATRLRRQDASDLAAADRQRWRGVRARLERRRHARVLRAQFRRDPKAYLSRLEQLLCQPVLPA
jgi:hypothetical protein